ncbi:hypothetical protein OB955_22090 [Halobacteria archaeon AArc-m2/3/4]|uniref:Uncharacterized protein n=1 Tax=Natronoglomus mannanivorans TaxID=2979990 RepID=A0ABT2QKC3_9EURY|nr:hypothetical protein [Halobacteria archaeon AArc-m2/3/4]
MAATASRMRGRRTYLEAGFFYVVVGVTGRMVSDPTADGATVANPFAEGSAEARLYGAIACSQASQTVAELTARTDCEPQIVRESLWVIVSLRVALEHRGESFIYERNDAYFEEDTVNYSSRGSSTNS